MWTTGRQGGSAPEAAQSGKRNRPHWPAKTTLRLTTEMSHAHPNYPSAPRVGAVCESPSAVSVGSGDLFCGLFSAPENSACNACAHAYTYTHDNCLLLRNRVSERKPAPLRKRPLTPGESRDDGRRRSARVRCSCRIVGRQSLHALGWKTPGARGRSAPLNCLAASKVETRLATRCAQRGTSGRAAAQQPESGTPNNPHTL